MFRTVLLLLEKNPKWKFIKVSEEYSLAIGSKGHHGPTEIGNDLNHTQYIKSNNITSVKKVGKIKFKIK